MANTLQHSPAKIVQHLLIALGVATLPVNPQPPTAWPVYADDEPDAPDDCVTVQTTPGRDDGRDQNSGATDGTNGIQIRVRSATKPAGWLKADAVQNAISLRATCYQQQVTVGTSNYLVEQFVRIGDPLPIGSDTPAGRRQLFTINAEVRIKQY